MNGKLFLLAVVCVSFVQVWGDDSLEDAIKAGVSRVKTGGKEFERRFAHIRKGIEYTHKKLDNEVYDFKAWMSIAETSDTRELEWNANRLKEKANGRIEPCRCIEEAQQKGHFKIAYYKKVYYDRGVAKMWPVFVFMRETATELKKKEEEVTTAHEEKIQVIKACDDVKCVEKAVQGYNRQAWIHEATISTIVSNYGHRTTTLGKQLDTYASTGKAQMRKSLNDAIAAMKACVKL